jgi:hypothetical protein
MFRPLATILILILFAFSCATTLNQKEEKIVYNSKSFIYKINSLTGGHCSSVFVSYKGKTRHVTNAHCCTTPMLYNGKNTFFQKIDEKNDLCELTHGELNRTGINLSQRVLEVTNIVYTVGFPGNYDLTIGQGRIVGLSMESSFNGQILHRTSSFAIPGSSGGAVLDEDGNLIGIVSQANGINHGSFIPVEVLRSFLN